MRASKIAGCRGRAPAFWFQPLKGDVNAQGAKLAANNARRAGWHGYRRSARSAGAHTTDATWLVRILLALPASGSVKCSVPVQTLLILVVPTWTTSRDQSLQL